MQPDKSAPAPKLVWLDIGEVKSQSIMARIFIAMLVATVLFAWENFN